MKIIKPSLLGAALLSSTVVFAAPAIEVSSSYNQQPAAAKSNSADRELVLELMARINELQAEVDQLRGLVEEQNFTIRQIEKTEKARYVDVDQRLSALAQGAGGVIAQTAASSSSNSALDYSRAVNLIREKQYQQAQDELEAFVLAYPKAEEMPSAQYWLGKMYKNNGFPKKARAMFFQTTEEFPKDARSAASLIELADLSLADQNVGLAKKYLQRVLREFAHEAKWARQAQAKLDILNGN